MACVRGRPQPQSAKQAYCHHHRHHNHHHQKLIQSVWWGVVPSSIDQKCVVGGGIPRIIDQMCVVGGAGVLKLESQVEDPSPEPLGLEYLRFSLAIAPPSSTGKGSFGGGISQILAPNYHR
jgi:hypothetical protein